MTTISRRTDVMATAAHEVTPQEASAHPLAESVVVRFAGDSGDGMQLTGGQFTLSTALSLGSLIGSVFKDLLGLEAVGVFSLVG